MYTWSDAMNMERRHFFVLATLYVTTCLFAFFSGVRDDQKRALLRAAASRLGDGAKELEPARLALLSAPLAAKKPKTLEMHGDVRVDDYYWLRCDL